ncbi:TetR family transcriptional regulator [Streptomyces sp. SID10853]|uniref:TetR/AcrR family transcriptional regulator n=1 Tax=Streptomyces sp. SID10853 TaxID=2706028 RepID=UPI0013C0A775|nr:TetR/AcrR family transcriptional regulator [Streptomyces sp. SID10853]NDZ78749.1 TetR family transcriptional regulator [Streptomyces sp. SID10853]
MARQERAEQTRQRLIEAAAAEFAAHGYAGTSLLGIVRSAGVTMGALTFHFSSKLALAEAVQGAGAAATREVMHGTESAAGLQGVLGGALALAAALNTTPSIRAAARFTREGRGAEPNWYASWVPQVREGLVREWPEKYRDSALTPSSATAFLTYLLAGFEATATARDALRDATGGDSQGELVQALQALTALVSAAEPLCPGAGSALSAEG